MTIPFTKMHGLGNDFVVIDARTSTIPLDKDRIRRLCDRRFGIGCDQLVLLSPPTVNGADVHVRFFNPDGSEAGACGNASRCVVHLLDAEPVLQTAGGLLPTSRHDGLITVNMGRARLEWEDVPLAYPCDTLHLPLHHAAACSMGNPHATLFEDIDRAETIGPLLETDPLFPERANIGFVQVLSRNHLRLRVWERGAGLTLACGSGACAAAINAMRRGLVDRHCTVTMDGGELNISWCDNGDVLMSGPAAIVFTGTLD